MMFASEDEVLLERNFTCKRGRNEKDVKEERPPSSAVLILHNSNQVTGVGHTTL